MIRFMNIGIYALLAAVLFSLSARQAPAEEPWTPRGLETFIFQNITDDASGNVYAIAYSTDFTKPIEEGLFRLRPGATEWTQIYDVYQTLIRVNSLVVPAPDTLLMATSEGIVYRSLDSGDTWIPVTLDTTKIHSLKIRSTGEIFAVGYYGYSISTDLGETWVSHQIPVSGQLDEVMFDDPNRIYIWNSDVLFRSEDNGVTWRIIYTLAFLDQSLGHMEVSPDGILYLLQRSTTFSSGGWNLLRSTDHGDKWQTILDFSTYPPDYSGVNSFTLSSTGELFVRYSGQLAILRSTDNGQTWTPEFADAPFYDDPEALTHALYINPVGTLYVGSDSGLYRYEIKVPVELSAFYAE